MFVLQATRIFENGAARLRCLSALLRVLFCRSETISKVGNIKIMSASSPFFFSPLSPPLSFLSRVVSRLMGVKKKTSFGVVPVKMGKSSGAIFSKIQVDIYIYIYNIYIYIYIHEGGKSSRNRRRDLF